MHRKRPLLQKADHPVSHGPAGPDDGNMLHDQTPYLCTTPRSNVERNTKAGSARESRLPGDPFRVSRIPYNQGLRETARSTLAGMTRREGRLGDRARDSRALHVSVAFGLRLCLALPESCPNL